MNDNELIERLAEAVAQRMLPAIPLSIDLWDMGTIAGYFKRSPSVVRERLACLPSFPKAIRLPSTTAKRGCQPLYKATEIIGWAESHREKN